MDRRPRSRLLSWPIAPCLAGLVPLVVYAFTACGHGYWLDSAEFSAAAVQLDIPHPPGHPIANLWGKAFALLPVGPLPYRVALGQAVAAALAVGFMQQAFARTAAVLGITSEPARSLLALGGAWALAGAYGFWFQAVRAEVYALEALLVCCALERLSALACTDTDDPRPLYQACLALGLGLANHHFIAILALPAIVPALSRSLRAHGSRVFGTALGAGALGLSCYVYLPLRAATFPSMDLGHPTSWRDFLWVVTAQVYARHIGTEARQPLTERFADLLVIVVENFTAWGLLLALLGSYVLLRARGHGPLAYLWIVTALISLCGRAWLNPVRANPDVLGYMMPGFAALVALAIAGIAALLASVPAGRAQRRALLLVPALSSLLGLAQFARESERASLRGFHAGDDFDDLRRRTLPARAVLLLLTPEAVFRHWEGEAVEQLRADVTMVPVPFLGYGGFDRALLSRWPELTKLVTAYQDRGELAPGPLAELAHTRPVLVELDAAAALPLFPFARPEGLLYGVPPEPPPRSAVARAGDARRASQAELLRRLGAAVAEPETRKQLLWIRYVEALYFAWHGSFELAREAARSGLALSPYTRELLALRRALDQPQHGPFELTPFLPHASDVAR